MSFERLRGLFRTLRFRLLVWNTGVVLLMVIPTLFLVREGYRRVMSQQFESILEEDLKEIKSDIDQLYPRWESLYQTLKRKAQSHAYHGWFVQLFDADENLKWETRSTPEDLPPLEKAANSQSETATHRLLQDRYESSSMSPLIIRVGVSFRPIQDDLSLLTQTLTLVGILITLLAPLGGYWLSGRAIRPMARIVETTSRLHPSELSERLPLRGTGDELDQLSQTINGLLDRIALYLEQKRDFLANAAHELRSPLAAIRSLLEIALNSERTTEEYVALLTDIMEECTGLAVLVNQLLLLAEGDAGRLALHTQSVRLDQVVRKSLDMFEGAAESQGIHLHAVQLEPVEVGADENHLRQVINNLVDNAIKFTPPGGEVRVEVGAQPEKNQATLCVADTGEGISPEDQSRIFERFYRSDKSRQHEAGRRGTGLGLSICQAIVTALRGTIAVDSIPGRGSRFTVSLPLHEAQN
jgi:heavy metal sensor kinase